MKVNIQYLHHNFFKISYVRDMYCNYIYCVNVLLVFPDVSTWLLFSFNACLCYSPLIAKLFIISCILHSVRPLSSWRILSLNPVLLHQTVSWISYIPLSYSVSLFFWRIFYRMCLKNYWQTFNVDLPRCIFYFFFL